MDNIHTVTISNSDINSISKFKKTIDSVKLDLIHKISTHTNKDHETLCKKYIR